MRGTCLIQKQAKHFETFRAKMARVICSKYCLINHIVLGKFVSIPSSFLPFEIPQHAESTSSSFSLTVCISEIFASPANRKPGGLSSRRILDFCSEIISLHCWFSVASERGLRYGRQERRGADAAPPGSKVRPDEVSHVIGTAVLE